MRAGVLGMEAVLSLEWWWEQGCCCHCVGSGCGAEVVLLPRAGVFRMGVVSLEVVVARAEVLLLLCGWQ